MADLAVAVALGGDAAGDIAVLRAQPGVFGPVASDPTVSRLITPAGRGRRRRPRRDQRRASGGAGTGLGPGRGAGPGRAGGDRSGRHVGHRALRETRRDPDLEEGIRVPPACSGSSTTAASSGGEPVSELLRPGKAGSNTAADHVVVLDAALAQLPAALRARDETGRVAVLVRTDAAGATKEFAAHLRRAGSGVLRRGELRPPRRGDRPRAPAREGVDAGLSGPQAPRRRARGADRAPRRGLGRRGHRADRAAAAGRPGTRLILRKERPHPGAQLRITDADGLRITGFLTNTAHGGPGRQLADLELRHRRHARVEDRIRAAKDTGLRNLPFHDTDQNRIWVAITALAQDLLAW